MENIENNIEEITEKSEDMKVVEFNSNIEKTDQSEILNTEKNDVNHIENIENTEIVLEQESTVKTENIKDKSVVEEIQEQETVKEMEKEIIQSEAMQTLIADIKTTSNKINIKQINLKLNYMAEINLGSNANKAILLMVLRK